MEHIISEVQIIPIKPRDGLVAFANFTYNNAFFFSGIGIYTRPQGGYRLTYPNRKRGEENVSIFHPINAEMGKLIEDKIIEKYESLMFSEEEF